MKRLMLIVSFALILLPASLRGQAKHSDYTLPEVPNRAEYIDFPSLDKGLWFAAQLSPAAAFATNSSRGTFVQADLIAGYRFGEFFRLGLGVSPRLVIPINSKSSMMFPPSKLGPVDLPIYLDVRGNIISQESRMAVPYWSMDLGYTIGQGIYASPTVGVRVGQPRNNFIAGLTYMFQYYGGALGVPCHAIGIRLGFEY